MRTGSYVYLTALAALGCGLASATASGAQWTKTWPTTAKPELRIETNDGSVTIHVWDEKKIEAVVTARGWEISSSEVRIHERQVGDRVELEARVPDWHMDFLNFGERSLKIDLHVPRDTRTDVHSGDGSVEVSGLQGEVRINTGDGSIHAMGVGGSLDARTGDGSVHADGRFDSLNVRTGDGSVNVRLPRELSADLDVHTGDGSLDVDLPLTMKSANTGEDRKDLHGKLNGGGQPVYIRTGDGGVHVRGS